MTHIGCRKPVPILSSGILPARNVLVCVFVFFKEMKLTRVEVMGDGA